MTVPYAPGANERKQTLANSESADFLPDSATRDDNDTGLADMSENGDMDAAAIASADSEPVGLLSGAPSNVFAIAVFSQSHAGPPCLRPELVSHHRFLAVPSSLVRRHVWRAIIRSSSVGMTHAEARLPVIVILGPPAAFAASSKCTPSHAACSHTRRRISAACSPMPAVKTSASSPPRAAASDPSSRLIR